MPLYRDMTDAELVDWAMEVRTGYKAASRVIYAMAMRLKERAHAKPAQPVPTRETARPRSAKDLLDRGALSREARAWLRAHRPEAYREMMAPASGAAGVLGSLGGLANAAAAGRPRAEQEQIRAQQAMAAQNTAFTGGIFGTFP